MDLLTTTLSSFLQIYFILLIVRILLSWFPNINWFDPPFSVLGQLTDPYLNLFRAVIPPLGGIDFSPILAIFVLQFVQGFGGEHVGGDRFLVSPARLLLKPDSATETRCLELFQLQRCWLIGSN